jgi:hypothetical protein
VWPEQRPHSLGGQVALGEVTTAIQHPQEVQPRLKQRPWAYLVLELFGPADLGPWKAILGPGCYSSRPAPTAAAAAAGPILARCRQQ